jgi:ParB-like chromosome segregation protein Spo0J
VNTNMIAIELIDANPWQPRMSEDIDHLANLAVSIADDGLMQIPSARRVGERYQLAFGHSRLAAFRLLGKLQKVVLLSELCVEADSAMARAWQAAQTAAENLNDFEQMPLNVMEIDDETMFRFAVSENVQRRDLNAIETAQAMLRYKAEFGRSSTEIGELFGVNDATVRGTLRLLDLPEEARGLLAKGEISQGAARALLAARPLASAAGLEKIAQEISAKADRITYSNVVRGALEHSDGVKLMWQDGNEGKPRAGTSWGNVPRWWPLEMTNFPNR